MGTLNCIYLFLFVLGVGYALVAVVLGGLSHIDIPGIDIDIPGVDLHPGEPDIHIESPFHYDVDHNVDHPDVTLSPLSPITIATFITTFGGVGLILNNLTALGTVWGLLISTAGALALAGAMFLLYTRVLMAQQSSSEVQAGELVGRSAEVITPIPAGEGKLGEIVLVARGSHIKNPARSVNGQPIPRGTKVEVMEEAGNIVVVQAKEAQVDQSSN